MLDAVIVPMGASQTASLPGTVFTEPGESIACTPLVDETTYWEASGTPAQAAAAFLAADAPSWIPNKLNGSGGDVSGGTTTYFVVGDSVLGPGWNGDDRLVFVIADLGNGSTGIRGDAEVIPPGSACLSMARARR